MTILRNFASVNKACRDAARANYRKRILNAEEEGAFRIPSVAAKTNIDGDDDGDDDDDILPAVVVKPDNMTVVNDGSDPRLEPWWLVQEEKLPIEPMMVPHPIAVRRAANNDDDDDDGNNGGGGGYFWELAGEELDAPLFVPPPPPSLPTLGHKLSFDNEYLKIFSNGNQQQKQTNSDDDDDDSDTSDDEDGDDEDGDDLTELVHLSVDMDRCLFVILCKWTGRRGDDYYYHNPNTRRQLFGLLYDLKNPPPPPPPLLNSGKEEFLLLPKICCALTDALDSVRSGSLNRVSFGNAQRSRNGKVLAVVTALPLGNEDNYAGEDNVRRLAEVTVFDLSSSSKEEAEEEAATTSIRKRCSLQFLMGNRTIDSSLTMSISNSGELLSVYTDHDDMDCRNWRLYDIRSSSTTTTTDGGGGEQQQQQKARVVAEKIGIDVSEEYVQQLERHCFTPDNELWMEIGEGTERDQESDEGAFFNHRRTRIPSWLAKRMIVWVTT